jgi:autotransporter-associated beta strand protein
MARIGKAATKVCGLAAGMAILAAPLWAGPVNPFASFQVQAGPMLYNAANWAGYAVYGSPETNNSVSAVSGSWIVPTAAASTSANAAANNNSPQCAVWVGIDGFGNSTVEQVGTESVYNNGSTNYYAWYELFPANMVRLSSSQLAVSPGDSVTGSVQYGLPSYPNEFLLTLTDNSTGKTFMTPVADAGASRSTAEWIAEAPAGNSVNPNGVFPLPTIGSVPFTSSSVTIGGITGPIDDAAFQEWQVNLTDSYWGDSMTPTAVSDSATASPVSSFIAVQPPGPPTHVWASAGSGNWSNSANWTVGVPNAITAVAAINAPTNVPLTVTLDIPVTIGTLTLGNSNSSSVGYTLSGSGANTLTLNNFGSGATITVSNGSHTINAAVVLADNLLVNGSGMLAFGSSSSITGGYSLTMSGTGGSLVLGGSNAYSGGTTINAGTLQAGSNSALGASTAVLTVNGGLLDVHGYNLNVGGLNGAGTVDNLSGSGSLTVGNGNASSNFSGTIQNTAGQLSLNKTGSGTFGLSGNVTLAGTATVSGGALNQSGGNLQAITLVVDGGTDNLGGTGQVLATNEYVGYAGSGTFNQTGGTNVITNGLYLGTNPGSNGTYNLLGGLLAVSSILQGSGSSSLNISGGSLTSPGGDPALVMPIVLTSSGGGTFDISSSTMTLEGPVSGAGSLIKNGPGTLVLIGSDNYSGGTDVYGGTLIVGSPNALLDGTSLTVGAGGALLFAPAAEAGPVVGSPSEVSAGVAVATVPEPGNLALLAAGVSLMAFAAWQRKNRSLFRARE